MEHSNSDSRYLSFACEEAEKSIATYRVGCVAVASGKIVARGCNNARTYSKDGIIGESLSCHAEIDVLRKIYKKGFTKNKFIRSTNNISRRACLFGTLYRLFYDDARIQYKRYHLYWT